MFFEWVTQIRVSSLFSTFFTSPFSSNFFHDQARFSWWWRDFIHIVFPHSVLSFPTRFIPFLPVFTVAGCVLLGLIWCWWISEVIANWWMYLNLINLMKIRIHHCFPFLLDSSGLQCLHATVLASRRAFCSVKNKKLQSLLFVPSSCTELCELDPASF